MFCVELDYEAKKVPVFSGPSVVYEKHRELLAGSKREIKKGYF